MTGVSEVPVVEVHASNIVALWPSLVHAIRSSTFIAIDTELSGLGDRKRLFTKEIDERYLSICEVAKTRSIISLGLSCFKRQHEPDSDDHVTETNTSTFLVQTFNIFVLCSETYVVEPLALQFLVSHGFDFNRQYAQGLPYSRGNDPPMNAVKQQQSLRHLFTELITSRVPIVLHNAFVDLIFLYESFYASLPHSLPSFLADLSQMFSAGIYDTKYIVEFRARWSASFLEYTYRKSSLDNKSRAARSLAHFDVIFPRYCQLMLPQVVLLPVCPVHCQNNASSKDAVLCQTFANHGWCALGHKCERSHDVDLILEYERRGHLSKKEQRAKKKSKNVETLVDTGLTVDDGSRMANGCHTGSGDGDVSHTSEPVVSPADNDVAQSASVVEEKSEKVTTVDRNTFGHRAGFDAFMTGCVFAWSVTAYGQSSKVSDDTAKTTPVCDITNTEFINRVYLGGKDFPLHITHSCFAKASKCHLEKWQLINSADCQ